MNDVALITFSSRRPTESYYHLDAFEASCKRQGAWPIFIDCGQWRGLMSKPAGMMKWISNNRDYYKYVIATDSWDVVLLSTLEEIITKFEAFNSPMVFNAERNCFPRADLADSYNPAPTPYRFLNSGFIVGTPSAFLDCLHEMHLQKIGFDFQNADGTWTGRNDQEFFSHWYLANQTKARLDHHATIAQTLHGAEDDEFTWDESTQRITSRITGSCPAVVHGNGGGKAWLEKIIKWMKL